jgi:hypothetical protein
VKEKNADSEKDLGEDGTFMGTGSRLACLQNEETDEDFLFQGKPLPEERL